MKKQNADKAQQNEQRPDPVAEIEAQFGDKLVKAREEFQENQAERARLDSRRSELVGRQTSVQADRQQRLIDHGKGIKGAAEKRSQAEAELESVNQELEAVDAAIAYEAARASTLQLDLAEMEAKLGEARKRQVQMEIAQAFTDKKEEFIGTFTSACIQLNDMVMLADKLMAVDGGALRDRVLEDLLQRTHRTVLIDRFKFTEPQSGSGLARRVFEVTALVPPPETVK